ncbi:enhancer of mRNA-decapping protein 3-like isoform X1 [Lytechinus variegatus]|uniref:enhancer of mRNA-decapping protein 3-like isoform X1 n=1 Tax=Lytechinus variegatus TaxID=7654 RepID=UPI001BB1326F|nr:enhancer of mRNA-decapping protein 3-like isoform X1 [Lytechinus variegatus]
MASESFIGNYLSLDCGPVLGTFQGEVSSVCKKGQTISLRNAFRNGVKYGVPEVTMRASDIKDLKILKTSADLKAEAEKNRAIIKAVSCKSKSEAVNGDAVSNNKDTSTNKLNGELSKPSLTAVRRSGNTERAHSKSPHRKPPTGTYKESSTEGGQKNKHQNHLNHSQRSAFHSPNRNETTGTDSQEKGRVGFKAKRSASFSMPQGKGDDSGRPGRPGFQRVHSVDGLSRSGGNENAGRDEEEYRQGGDKGRRRTHSGNHESNHTRSSPVKISGGNTRKHNRGGFNSRNAECFSAPVESFLNDDFDFDSNFALFDKENFYEELEAMGDNRPKRPGPRNLRFDENILERRESEEGKRITCPDPTGKWYHTDTDMQIPGISPELKARLMSSAMKVGHTVERRLESVGLCAAQVALQLLDKQRRIHSKKRATEPSVVVLCGPHLEGAQGVSCARHLTYHGCTVTLFVPNFVKMLEELRQEMDLFDATDGLKLQSYKDLPKSTDLTDMVICALDTPNDTITQDQAWYRGILQWLSETNKAPILSVDPSNTQSFPSQWGVAVGLPLDYTSKVGDLYLCSSGIPKKAFDDVGVRYMSPFSRGLFVHLDVS